MADLLVRLHDLPAVQPALGPLQTQGIVIRRAEASEGSSIATWVRQYFQEAWAEASQVAVLRQPGTCWLAVEPDRDHVPQHAYDLPAERLLGFSCYDTDIKGVFGPIGVRPDRRRGGIGTALLIQTLHAMRQDSYAYAIIGWAGPVEWYTRTVGATVIANSEPGVFHGRLQT